MAATKARRIALYLASTELGIRGADLAQAAGMTPAAVSIADDGYLQVNYGLLGIAFLTYSDWVRSHAIPN